VTLKYSECTQILEPVLFKAAEANYNIKLIPTPLFWEFTEAEKM